MLSMLALLEVACTLAAFDGSMRPPLFHARLRRPYGGRKFICISLLVWTLYHMLLCYLQIESLKKALGYSQDENFRLKAQIAKVNSFTSLY